MADVISDPNLTGMTLYLCTHIPNALISFAGMSLEFAIQSGMKRFNVFLLLKQRTKNQQKTKTNQTQQIIEKKKKHPTNIH